MNIEGAFERSRQLRTHKDFKTDAELANCVLNVHVRSVSSTW